MSCRGDGIMKVILMNGLGRRDEFLRGVCTSVNSPPVIQGDAICSDCSPARAHRVTELCARGNS